MLFCLMLPHVEKVVNKFFYFSLFLLFFQQIYKKNVSVTSDTPFKQSLKLLQHIVNFTGFNGSVLGSDGEDFFGYVGVYVNFA